MISTYEKDYMNENYQNFVTEVCHNKKVDYLTGK